MMIPTQEIYFKTMNMNKKLIILCSFILLNLSVYSQDFLNIKGDIIDSLDKNLNSIMLITDENNTFVKVIECKDGKFDLNLPANMDYTITFMQQDYKSKSIDISVTKADTLNFKVRLLKSGDYPVPVAVIFYDEYSKQYNYAVVKH